MTAVLNAAAHPMPLPRPSNDKVDAVLSQFNKETGFLNPDLPPRSRLAEPASSSSAALPVPEPPKGKGRGRGRGKEVKKAAVKRGG